MSVFLFSILKCYARVKYTDLTIAAYLCFILRNFPCLGYMPKWLFVPILFVILSINPKPNLFHFVTKTFLSRITNLDNYRNLLCLSFMLLTNSNLISFINSITFLVLVIKNLTNKTNNCPLLRIVC